MNKTNRNILCFLLFFASGCEQKPGPNAPQPPSPKQKITIKQTSSGENSATAVISKDPSSNSINSPTKYPDLTAAQSVADFRTQLDSVFEAKGWNCLRDVIAAASTLETNAGSSSPIFQVAAGEWAAEKYITASPKPDVNLILEALASGKPLDAQKNPSEPGNAFIFKLLGSPHDSRSIFDYYLTHPYPSPLVVSLDNVAAATAERIGYITTIEEISKAVSPQVKESFFGSVVNSWINSEPEAASKWIKDLPDGDARGNAVRIMVLNLASHGDIEAARAWMPYGRPDRAEEMNAMISMYEAKFKPGQ